ncbi:hypothetical protein O1L68_05840 [Streptomyces lydicus]|nr:hypothetical protein [Streptomyces lydicus]
MAARSPAATAADQSPPAWAWPANPPGPSAPLELRVVVDMVLPVEEPPPVPPWYRRGWHWLTDRTSPYAAILALAASVAPIPGVGYGIGPIWGSLLYAVRITTHPAAAYVIGLGTAALAGRRLVRHGGAWSLFLLATTTVGAVYGVIRPLDIVTALTGVPTS